MVGATGLITLSACGTPNPRILDATEELLTEQLFESLTISAIARRAGVAVGTIYTRFENKEALLPALFERHHESADQRNDEKRKQKHGLAPHPFGERGSGPREDQEQRHTNPHRRGVPLEGAGLKRTDPRSDDPGHSAGEIHETVNEQLRVNVTSQFLCAREAVKRMSTATGGKGARCHALPRARPWCNACHRLRASVRRPTACRDASPKTA